MLEVQEVAHRAGVGYPGVWRWQQRFAEAGVEALLRDKTRCALGTVAKVLSIVCSEPPDEVTGDA